MEVRPHPLPIETEWVFCQSLLHTAEVVICHALACVRRQLRVAVLSICVLLPHSHALASELAFCTESGPENFAPSLIRVSGSSGAALQIYDGLVTFPQESTEIIPSLAQKWDISADGRVYTFYLRRGVKWQSNAFYTPTRDFNADDVIFTFERQWKPNHPYFKVTSAKHGYFEDNNLDGLLQDVQKIDDYTVKITLKQVNATFLATLSMPYMLVQSKEYADAMLKAGTPERIDTEPIGTGPFQVVTFQKNELVRFKAFERHWQGRPKLDSLVFRITPDPTRSWRKTQQGLCHIMTDPHPADLFDMQKNPNFRIVQRPHLSMTFLAYNTQKKPFNDVRVRQALSMAIDKSNIISSVYLDTGIAAVNPLPPGQWAYDTSIKDYPFNPPEAKRLLAQANYPNGFEATLWAFPTNLSRLRAAELVRTDLAKIGVKINLVICATTPECITHMHNGDHQMAIVSVISQNGDPDEFFTGLTCKATIAGGSNIAKWCYPPFDTIIEQARSTNSMTERLRLYQRAQVIFHEQNPWLPLLYSNKLFVASKDVVGTPGTAAGRLQFYNVNR